MRQFSQPTCRGTHVADLMLDRSGGRAGGRAGGRIARGWRPALAWTLAGSWGAWTVARLTGADRWPGLAFPAAPLLALTPYVAATAPVPVLCALALGRRRAALVAAVAAAGLAATVLPRAIASPQPPVSGPMVRVLSANLLFSHVDPDFLYDLIRRTRPDLVSIQEFTQDEADGLEKAGLGALLPYHVLDAHWLASGSGLYSRHPVTALPPQPGTSMAMPRAAVALPRGRRAEVTVVHPLPPIDPAQTRAWLHDLGTLPPAAGPGGPIRILAGDYNATLDMALLRSVLAKGYVDAADQQGGGLDPTWGVSMSGPPLSLDHILADRRCAVRRYEVHDLPGSDHRAVLADLQLP